jgi:hypothetical protein
MTLPNLITELERRQKTMTPSPWREESDQFGTTIEAEHFTVANDLTPDDAEGAAFLRNHAGKIAEMLRVAERTIGDIAVLDPALPSNLPYAIELAARNYSNLTQITEKS